MNNKLQQFIAGFSFLTLLYCFYQMNHPQKVQVQKAVYNWKTNFSRSTYYNAYEDSFVTSHQIKKMYVKMLDIEYSEAQIASNHARIKSNSNATDYYEQLSGNCDLFYEFIKTYN